MEEKFSNSEILEAVNSFLNDKSKVINKSKNEKYSELPKDTEKIILEAEKFLKK
tara:strand:- start:948 stop:1109 length:162 start_codon:yes stop_codon:yes gene_type:complete